MKRIITAATWLIFTACWMPISAQAVLTNPFTVVGVNDTNNTAQISFDITDQTANTLTLDIKITNTSPLFDPIITGFAFNSPSDVTSLDSFSFSGVSMWDAALILGGIGTPQSFGMFDVCAEEGNNPGQCSGGNPNNGITMGNMATFVFDFVGTGLDLLTESSFLDVESMCPTQGSCTEVPFLARFQRTGMDGNGSDVAVPGDPGPLPEPGILGLMGVGLLGFSLARRREQRLS